jgi:hypothetical protein
MVQMLQTVFVYLVIDEMSLKMCLTVGRNTQLLRRMVLYNLVLKTGWILFLLWVWLVFLIKHKDLAWFFKEEVKNWGISSNTHRNMADRSTRKLDVSKANLLQDTEAD